MNGHAARRGFQFQDLYLLRRILSDATESLDHAWQVGLTDVLQILDRNDTRYGIEASQQSSDSGIPPTVSGPDWDVLVLAKNKLEFAEVKSGTVSKEDRLAFWRRLRRELANPTAGNDYVVPVLVLDPSVVGDVEKWRDLPSVASNYSGSPPAAEPTNNVLNVRQLLEEALWWLCRPDRSQDGTDAAVSIDVTIASLGRFELHLHEAAHLEAEVLQMTDLLFPGGLAETEQTLLLGWLGGRATALVPQRRLFTIRELLAEIGILENAVSLTPGALKEWHELWNEVPQGVLARTRLQLGTNGESFSPATVQPAATALLTSAKTLLILGLGGVGKSAFLTQAAQVARRCDDTVLHCAADDVTADELEKLIRAFRFRAAMAAVRNPSTRARIFVDALDEADPSLRKRWAQLLARMAGLRNIALYACVRETVWKSDGQLRTQLAGWQTVTLALWPEQQIRAVLALTAYHERLPARVLDLLRTPILLDLFWRTFVESGSHDVPLASQLQTRHKLIAVYWEQRLIHSPRHTSVSELLARLHKFFSQAVEHIGSFPDTSVDAEITQLLLSEGVVVREGKLQPRLRFRHPLLRDFAFGQWCLAAKDAKEAARRWNSIQGGLQRYGALRAVFEALSDASARNEYPHLQLGTVVQAIVQTDIALSTQVAQVLGTHAPSAELDPAKWPANAQSSLPSRFGCDLLTAAKLHGNSSWAECVEQWPDDAAWLDQEYPKELWVYASTIAGLLTSNIGDPQLREQCRQAARKLRSVSEAQCFAAEFNRGDRWLMMHSVLLVVPLLPDAATMAWVERELAKATWRTREAILKTLVYLAPVDAPRVANIYRKSVGLTRVNGAHVLEQPALGGLMDHYAIEWSLAGEDGYKSLLKENPEAFLPVALELAEALWHGKQTGRSENENGISELIREFDPSWSVEVEAERERERHKLLGGLIDDWPQYSYWQSFPKSSPQERCLTAIHECLEQCAKNSLENFAVSITPIVRSSRLGSVQSILLDVLLERRDQPLFRKCIVDLMLDSRLYYISGIEYWLEQGLLVAWSSASPDQRDQILEILGSLLNTEGEEHNVQNFLLRIPIEDLPETLRAHRPSEDDSSHAPYEKPHRSDIGFEGVPVQEDDERLIGSWPDTFDADAVRNFFLAAKNLSRQNSTIEELRDRVPGAVQTALLLTPKLRNEMDLLREPSHWWVWRSLAEVLDCFRKLQGEKEFPPEGLIRDCTEIALHFLRRVPSELPGELPTDDVWTHYRETDWVCALRLADSVLTWPPVADDQTIQREFEGILQAAFETEQPLVQLVCTTNIRPWHWFRGQERRQLHDRLIWNLPKHASVLTWSLSRSSNYPDAERTRVFRLLLNRADVEDSKQLAHRLGWYVGIWSMAVNPSGQRSAVAELGREAIENPEGFSLLRDSTLRHEFLRQFAFGMKAEVSSSGWVHRELAIDYGNWALKIWRTLRSHRQRRNESEGVVLITLHWLERKARQQREIATLKIWWRHLTPLITAVVAEGGRPDCFTLFFNFREGEYNDLAAPEELLRFGEALVQRLRAGLQAGTIVLDETDPQREDWHSWREVTESLAETTDSLRRDGSLQTDLQREQAHKLLAALAAEPVRSTKAVEVLHLLQND